MNILLKEYQQYLHFLFYKNDMMHAWPPEILTHCLYLAQLNPVVRIGDIAEVIERWTADLEIACSSPLYATIFLPTMFASNNTSLQVETHN